MASNFKIAAAVRSAMADAAVDRLDLNTPPAVLRLRTGGPPANVSDASTGTLLAEVLLDNPAFGAASSGVATANSISAVTAVGSGDCEHFRVYQGASGDTAAEWQGTAGEAADTPDLEFDNKTFVTGGDVLISALTFTMPIQCA